MGIKPILEAAALVVVLSSAINLLVAGLSSGPVDVRVVNSSLLETFIFPFLLFTLLVPFYTVVIAHQEFQKRNLADNIQRQGGFISGVRPGKATETYLAYINWNISLYAGIVLSILISLTGCFIVFTNLPV